MKRILCKLWGHKWEVPADAPLRRYIVMLGDRAVGYRDLFIGQLPCSRCGVTLQVEGVVAHPVKQERAA